DIVTVALLPKHITVFGAFAPCAAIAGVRYSPGAFLAFLLSPRNCFRGPVGIECNHHGFPRGSGGGEGFSNGKYLLDVGRTDVFGCADRGAAEHSGTYRADEDDIARCTH